MSRVFKSPLFWIGLGIKIVFLFFGGAENFHKLFIPFLDSTVTHLGENPWSLFPAHYFPYGSIQLIIFALPKFLLQFVFGMSALGEHTISYFSIKLVLLLFDFLILKQLLPLAVASEKRILIYYWLNPILFYISYIHGQLDVVPMFFTIVAVLYLSRKNVMRFSLSLSLAILCKFHTLAILPLAMAYIWNTNFRKESVIEISKSLLIIFSLVTAGFLPQILSSQISSFSLGSPEALSIFGANLPIDGQRTIYLGFLLIVCVILRLCISTRLTADGLIFGSGIIFGSLILGSSAQAGWYFWFFPFVALFYSTRSFKFLSVLIGSYFIYLIHFVIKDFIPDLANPFLLSMSFSLLQVSILFLVVSIWFSVISSEAPLLRRVRPLMIGIAGNSGSGKNTVTHVVQNLFGLHSASVVEGDDYHKWERGNEKWQDYTHLNPKANFLDNMAAHTRALSLGKLVFQPHYDHGVGQFTDPRSVETSKNLIVQGLHTFYLTSLRNLFDIKIFMAPDEELRTAWKVERDVKERGHQVDQVVQSIRSRELDSLTHIQPQKKWADWIIESKIKNPGSVDFAKFNGAPEFYVRHILWNDTPLGPLIDSLQVIANVQSSIEINIDNLDQVIVQFTGNPTAEHIARIAERSFPFLRHLSRSYESPIWMSGNYGLFQLVLLALIQRQNLKIGRAHV